MSAFFSGDPLPIAPTMDSGAGPGVSAKNFVELEAFNRKLLEYLRRLGLHLSNPDVVTDSSSPAVESLALSFSGNHFISGTPYTPKWDQVLRQDAPYSYDTATGVTTFSQDGFYLILVDIDIPGDLVHTTQFVDGDSNVLPYGSFHYDGGIQTQVNESSSIPIHLHADQTLEFQIVDGGGSSIIALNSRMTILKLGNFSGSGSDSPDPCDLDIWQICP